MPSSPGRLRSVLRQVRQTRADDRQLSRRLVAALAGDGGVTLSDLQRLMTALSAPLCTPAMALLAALQVWQRQARWLTGVTRELAEAMVEAMLSDLDGPPNARRWLRRLLSVLSRHTAAPAARIVAEWRDNARTDRTVGQLDAALAPLLLNYASAGRRRASAGLSHATAGLPRVSAPTRRGNTFASGGGAPTRPAAMPAIRPDSPLNHPPAEGRPAERNRLDAATRGESCWPWSETENVLTRWLTQGTLPAAARETGAIPFNESAWLMALLLRDPRLFAQCVRPLYSRPAVKTRLLNQLSLGVVAQALAQSDVSAAVSIPTIPALRTLLLRLALPAVSQAVRQQSLLACLLDAWLRPGHGRMDTDALVRQLFWRLLRDGGCSRAQLLRALRAPGLPAGHGLRHALDAVIELLARGKTPERALSRPRAVEPARHDDAPQTMPLMVGNAGVVLLQSYIRPLFERLRLVSDNAFVSAGAQRAAVHYLQYLITGQSHSEEHELALNKLLCGLPLSHPLDAGVAISSDEIATIHSLIEAVAQYWPAIGKTSVAGFRGNWLVREGSLTEKSEHWELVVTRRSYDILIGRSSLSYAIVRLPWMNKPIYVTWPV
ncbi:contractile injection system tape measure protein, partial [Dickeya dianthicola]|uniref:contractile injection system tape measure protein n=1 Tax=Dickeya dianthicola TaxID=204039 RepID=UPI0022B760B5